MKILRNLRHKFECSFSHGVAVFVRMQLQSCMNQHENDMIRTDSFHRISAFSCGKTYRVYDIAFALYIYLHFHQPTKPNAALENTKKERYSSNGKLRGKHTLSTRYQLMNWVLFIRGWCKFAHADNSQIVFANWDFTSSFSAICRGYKIQKNKRKRREMSTERKNERWKKEKKREKVRWGKCEYEWMINCFKFSLNVTFKESKWSS